MNSQPEHAMQADNDISASRYWHEWQIDGRERRIILCVETNLELRAGYPGFDPARLDALVRQATELMRASPSPIDAIRIVPHTPMA